MARTPRPSPLLLTIILVAAGCASATPTVGPSGTPSPGAPTPVATTPGGSAPPPATGSGDPTEEPAASGVTPEPSAPGPTEPPASTEPTPPPPTEAPPTGQPTEPPDAPPARPVEIDVVEVASGFENANGIFHAGDERLFVTEQEGYIDLLLPTGGGRYERSGMFLDIRDKVSCCGEKGLLGLAFHPDYAENGLFYITFADNSHNFVLEERRVSPEDPDRADTYRRLVFKVYKPYNYHWGGNIQFGPDGYLYLGMGDGGFGGGTNDPGDPQNLSQDLGSYFGKFLRFDPTDPDGDGPAAYTVPADNPYVGRDGALPEIWARGLRNPWRWSFDRLTGDLWIADTGHADWEEVNRAPSPELGRAWNYGWRLMEGPDCYIPATGCDPEGRTKRPIAAYRHQTTPGGFQCAVTGGFTYRGEQEPELRSWYIFGDYCSGTLFGVRSNGPDEQRARAMLDTDLQISGMGEDVAGELYVVDYGPGNRIYRIVAEPAG